MSWKPYAKDTLTAIAQRAREQEQMLRHDGRLAAADYINHYVAEQGWSELDRLEILGSLGLLPEQLEDGRDSYEGREIPTLGSGSGRGTLPLG